MTRQEKKREQIIEQFQIWGSWPSLIPLLAVLLLPFAVLPLLRLDLSTVSNVHISEAAEKLWGGFLVVAFLFYLQLIWPALKIAHLGAIAAMRQYDRDEWWDSPHQFGYLARTHLIWMILYLPLQCIVMLFWRTHPILATTPIISVALATATGSSPFSVNFHQMPPTAWIALLIYWLVYLAMIAGAIMCLFCGHEAMRRSSR